ncbi:hypothetical protein L198_06955 [Cryptococcus wingfieldii CBS 7118]|uniref:N-acetyltransferase domain-containing protein n=1 Tax=Cryptococcus wingfieldii CBS 7118 TaxID=1295528 RepID=A0A1E3IH27_9TREE|nr:hypothetical protein L198_06955 [Cryptococcus wingfieldii CBS 7118]ODN87725.1 hypothetical protein L198_06955 [Cryptococcus wingfieldii CBS 7118]
MSTNTQLEIHSIDCLTNPSLEEQSQCSTVLQDAYVDDRYVAKVCGNSADARRLFYETVIEGTTMDCELWVTRVKDESAAGGTTIASVACVSPPGKTPFSDSPNNNKEEMMERLTEKIPESVDRWIAKHLNPHYVCAGHFNEDSLFIHALATRPEYQRGGSATALLSRLGESAKQRGERLGLDTSNASAAKLFEKTGFRDIHSGALDFEDGGDEVRYRIMSNDSGWTASK